jgi:hypothetical protein
MPSLISRRAVSYFGAGLAGVSLVLASVGLAYGGSGWPTGISVDQSGLTVTASGTWSWPEMDTNPKLSWTGFAISWGDVTQGNTLGAYHLGDGTPATNLVTEIPIQGDHGPWGPVSHTYAAPGTYTVCAIIYDLGEVIPFKTIGYHSTKASGTSRNSDNSVDKQTAPPVECATIDVAAGEGEGGGVVIPPQTPTPTEQPTATPTEAPAAGVTPAPNPTPGSAPVARSAPKAPPTPAPPATPAPTQVSAVVPAGPGGVAGNPAPVAQAQPANAPVVSITLLRASASNSAPEGKGGSTVPLAMLILLALGAAGLGTLGALAARSVVTTRR